MEAIKDKTKVFINLKNLSGEEIKEIEILTGNPILNGIVSNPIFHFAYNDLEEKTIWFNFSEEYLHRIKDKTEISLSEFRQLFSKGEEVLQVEKSKASSFILGQIDKKIEQINEIDIAHTEGVLIGLNICKQLWAQGTISHETIQEEMYHYQEELDNLKNQ